MRDQVKIFDTLEELASYFALLLESRIRNKNNDQAFSWMLSGGTTPKSIFKKIAANYKNSIDWNKVKIFWGDERCVSPADDESNYRMARENLLDDIPIPPANVFRIHGESEPEFEARRYSTLFSRHVTADEGIPQADLIMLGLGEDGHTASIFPANIGLFGSNKLFEPSENPLTKQKRITATGKVINNARTVIFLVSGESKAKMLVRIIERKVGWQKLPASLVHPVNGEPLWLLDELAAKQLIIRRSKNQTLEY